MKSFIKVKNIYGLYPCPFCDSDDVRVKTDDGWDLKYAHCWNCGASGPWADNETYAKNYWNKMIPEYTEMAYRTAQTAKKMRNGE